MASKKLKDTPYFGRRTKKPVLPAKIVRKVGGVEKFEDYWSSSCSSSDEARASNSSKAIPSSFESVASKEIHLEASFSNITLQPSFVLPAVDGENHDDLQDLVSRYETQSVSASTLKEESETQDDCLELPKPKVNVSFLTRSKVSNRSFGRKYTTRKRCKPLRYWCNERQVPQISPSGNISFRIDPGTKDMLAHYQGRLKARSCPNYTGSGPLQDVALTDGVPVIDSRTGHEVDAQIIQPFDALPLDSPSRDHPFLQIRRSFVFEDSSNGFLTIPGYKKKKKKFALNSDMVFTVVSGSIGLKMDGTAVKLTQNDTFVVPRNTMYSLENLGPTKATFLFFTNITVP